MIPEQVYKLCRSGVSVASEYERDPSRPPHEISSHLFGTGLGGIIEHKNFKVYEPSDEDIQQARECGKWGKTEPSRLFLKIYHDVLRTLAGDPLATVTSPSLLGSTGVVPLTIIAPLPDICRHMANCIARAEKDVFLATNYWMKSDASKIITNAFKELSRRAGERGTKAVVKVMYDRGNPKQVFNNHQKVAEKDFTGSAVGIPPRSEMPNIELEVVNYHRPVLGTFHSKYMVVDRRIAVLSSNNIQDNDNLEMMVQVEGDIVDSFYDMSLITWHNSLDPPLPTSESSAVGESSPSFRHLKNDKTFDGTHESNGTNESFENRTGTEAPDENTSAPENGQALDIGRATATQAAVDKAAVLVNRDREPLAEHTSADPRYDDDIAGEVLRIQSVLAPKEGESRMQAVTRHLNTTIQKDTTGDAPECQPGDEMVPYITLPKHDPVPMAMVGRKSFGALSHACVHVPQNEAWLSAIRYAQKSVFIQTPNLNADPLLPEILSAVRRGIEVAYYVCLGYNDAGELLPLQGGNNELVAYKLYTSLNSEEEKSRLRIFNYVGKDQTKPIHNSFKKRSCHIKLMVVDGHIGIQGSGNQDTQSWFHSQEVNIMLDSEAICASWMEGIRRNQNTNIYGAVSDQDGCWHDEKGAQVDGAIGHQPGRFSWLKGITGAIARVKGVGGF